jgi:Tol biopolymer transport system component
MTPERWKRTEELFHAAIALPPGERAAFLLDACRGDDALRRDLESLLNDPDRDDEFLAGAAFDISAPLASDDDAAMIGRSLGGYELVALLGAGGMGKVFRARDPKLGRDVAIKILPPAFTSHPDRLARFEREARMLAALNHPNICAIYGLEDADGVRYLILELVDGETLAERLARFSRLRPGELALPLGETLAIARQIVDALEVAHEKGIIHRDLKPANIQITSDGVVKVLDFGLAKPVGDEGPGSDLTHLPGPTGSHLGEGALIGTAAYMSPEQARGLKLDKRTDIWAFGCVLYEMLTGRVAFAGDTISDSIAKILEREPDWSMLPAQTPAAIRQLLFRCLEKDPKKRVRDIGDVRIEIDAIDEPQKAIPTATQPGPGRRGIVASWLPWVALVALAVGVVGWEVRRPAATQENPLAAARFTLLTNWDGAEEGADISPDGKFIAFLADRTGEFDIWLTQVGTGRFSNLTADFPPLAPSGVIVRKLGFSGDGADIWFNPADRKPLLLMPMTGGTPRAFLPGDTNTPKWSPDGAHLVYFGKPPEGDDPMYIADRTGADPRQLLTYRGGVHNNNPVWSPDGQWIYFVSGVDPQDEMDVNIWRVRSSGGTPEQLTSQHAAVSFLASIDTRTLLYVSRDEDGSGPWLWSFDVERKQRTRVPSGVDRYTSVAASRDGRRIVATVANPSATLWQVPLRDRVAEDPDVQPYSSTPVGQALAPRFGGRSLFYLSARGMGDGLWRIQDGQQPSQVWRNVDDVLTEPPAVSPDGSRLAVVFRRQGRRQLTIMSADGTNARTLAPSIDIQGAAGQGTVDWSPDGKEIVTGGQDERGPALFKIPVDGTGAPVRLVEGKWVNPIWSPDGKLIVYAGRSIVGQVTLRGVRPDGTAVELPNLLVRPGGYRFVPDGSGLVYLPLIHTLDFEWLDLATMKSRPLTRLSNQGTIRTFDITPDGKYIVFDRSRQNSNIVLIELPNE